MSDISAEKASLREAMRRLRASIPAAERTRLAEIVEESLFDLPEMETAGTVLLFYSFGSEIATGGMASRVLETGRRLLLPYLSAGEIEAAEVRADEELTPTGYGPREPSRKVAVDPSTVDLVVTPGLAFDRRGHRLGYGEGYYDRFLARLGPRAARVGVAFSVQILEEVPAGPGDQRVDLVVTDAGVVQGRRAGSQDADG